MNHATMFLVSALFFGVTNIVLSILIMRELEKRGIKTSILLARFLIPKYVHQYKEITKKETGYAGAMFYYWIISINLSALTAVIGLILYHYT